MKLDTPTSRVGGHPDPENFSLVLGGPLFQFWVCAHLADDTLLLVRKRMIFMALLVWLPLLVLSVFEGHFLSGSATVPFLMDIEAHVRFLVVVPLLIGAELVVHHRMRPVVAQFMERQLIPDAEMWRFDRALEKALALRNSKLAEVLLIAFVYGVGILFVWRQYVALDTGTWDATPSAQGPRLSLAGIWYGYLSLPLFQFLLVRWYFRIGVWALFLWRVSRIPLQLIPSHPDRNGGLGFLSNTAYAFTLLAVAHGAVFAGQIANRIFFLHAALTDFKMLIAFLVFLVLCLIFSPLLVFGPQICAAQRKGAREYGVLAQRYVRGFDIKWLRGGAPADEPLVGSADIQSLADLANSVEVVRTMRMTPVTRDAVLWVAGSVLLPIVPLVLTMMPLEELLKALFGMVF